MVPIIFQRTAGLANIDIIALAWNSASILSNAVRSVARMVLGRASRTEAPVPPGARALSNWQ